MLKNVRSILLFAIIAGCVEPYEFRVNDDTPSLVIEGFISDKSFNETREYPSDGRYFTVKLSETGDVTNVKPVPVAGAIIELLTSEGRILHYTEREAGIYRLEDNDFKGVKGIGYKLKVQTRDEIVYESTWEGLPGADAPLIGNVDFTETENEVYVMEAGKWVARKKQVVLANIEIPENATGERIYYRWTFSPTWIYVAPLISQASPVYKCWATDPNYFPSYDLQDDRAGGYRKDLFSFPTIRNERIFEKLSVLITQYSMTEPYYNFWKEMKDRNEGGAFLDTPPYNLRTNFSVSESGKKIAGYFSVTSEQATRWYFDKSDLSYYVENTLRADCLVVYGPGPPAEECTDCRFYSFGQASTTRPLWWED